MGCALKSMTEESEFRRARGGGLRWGDREEAAGRGPGGGFLALKASSCDLVGLCDVADDLGSMGRAGGLSDGGRR